VPFENFAESQRLPHLAEPRVNIEEHTPAGTSENFRVVQVTHHVDECTCMTHALEHHRPRNSDNFFAAVVIERKAIVQIIPPHDVEEVLQIT
jgi:hypothetical protein